MAIGGNYSVQSKTLDFEITTKNNTRKLKFKFYKTMTVACFLTLRKTWVHTRKITNQIESSGMGFLRRTKRICTRQDRITR